MSELVKIYAETAAGALEVFGISIIIIYTIYSSLVTLVGIIRDRQKKELYHKYRHELARGILVGLEIMVAADIVHTVAVDLTFQSLGVLAIIVLIRTFLSFTLELEATGKWPWQQKTKQY